MVMGADGVEAVQQLPAAELGSICEALDRDGDGVVSFHDLDRFLRDPTTVAPANGGWTARCVPSKRILRGHKAVSESEGGVREA